MNIELFGFLKNRLLPIFKDYYFTMYLIDTISNYVHNPCHEIQLNNQQIKMLRRYHSKYDSPYENKSYYDFLNSLVKKNFWLWENDKINFRKYLIPKHNDDGIYTWDGKKLIVLF